VQKTDENRRAHEETQPHRKRFENRMPNNNKIGSKDGRIFAAKERQSGSLSL